MSDWHRNYRYTFNIPDLRGRVRREVEGPEMLDDEILRRAAVAIAADTPLGEMHRAREIAERAIRAALGSDYVILPIEPSGSQ